MSEYTSYKCDCDNPQCQRTKEPKEVWWLAQPMHSQGAVILSEWDAETLKHAGVKHLSSPQCVLNFTQHWMNDLVNRPKEIPADEDKEYYGEKEVTLA